jgi:hypothetical protein
VPSATAFSSAEQQAPASRSGAIERREKDRTIDGRLEDEASLDERRVGEAADALPDQELVETL